ncbi:MAG: tripartite tricarboxylate transporter substrate binding protein [Burkholderiaceae bacterium]
MINRLLHRLPGLALVVATALAGLAAGPAAHAQERWPARPIRIVVPFAPGGSADAAARFLAPKLAERLGQQVIVENRPGAGGTLAVGQVAKAAAPDGYTLLLAAAGALTISPHLVEGLNYEPLKDLAPVTGFARIPLVLIANAGVPAGTPAQLIELLRRQPGRFSYATTGNGSAMHLGGESFKSVTGTYIVHIPYRGSAPAVSAVMSGEVELGIVDLTSVIGRTDTSRFKTLALLGKERSSLAPSLPTLSESGVPGFDVSGWFGLFAPVKVDAAIVQRLNAEITALLRSDEMKERFRQIGVEAMPTSPQQLGEFLRAESGNFAAVIKRARIQAN